MTSKNENTLQWEGGRITNRLQLWPDETLEGFWQIHGKDDYVSATGTPEDLLKLAHTILEHFQQDSEDQET